MTGRFIFSVVVLTIGAAAIAIGVVMPLLGPAGGPYGKGGPESTTLSGYYLAPGLMLAGTVGILVGSSGIAWSRPSWRRLALASVVCGALALLLVGPVPWIPWWPAVAAGYAGIWLGGLLGLVATGAAVGAFTRPMRAKAFETAMAVMGLVTGIPSSLFAGWILLLILGGGIGE